jgi:hypothetical protein
LFGFGLGGGLSEPREQSGGSRCTPLYLINP